MLRKYRKINAVELLRLLRFGLAGIAATVVYLLLFITIDAISEWDVTIISVLAYVLSIGFSYFAQSRFTFRVERDTRTQMIRFVVTSLIGLLVSAGALEVSKAAGWPNWMGAALVGSLVPVLNFLILSLWVFRTETPS